MCESPATLHTVPGCRLRAQPQQSAYRGDTDIQRVAARKELLWCIFCETKYFKYPAAHRAAMRWKQRIGSCVCRTSLCRPNHTAKMPGRHGHAYYDPDLIGSWTRRMHSLLKASPGNILCCKHVSRQGPSAAALACASPGDDASERSVKKWWNDGVPRLP